VPWCVGDDEPPARRREVAVRDIDGDALLALGGEAVEEEREVEFATLGADPLGVVLEAGEKVVEKEARLPEQPADQSALAVVDAAAGDEAEEVDRLPLAQERVELGGGGAQKYPSCFFFSIDDGASRSMTRPCRSDVCAAISSLTMSASVAASLSTAPVSG